jgi:hypothetical protein
MDARAAPCGKPHDRGFGSLASGRDAGHCGPSCLFGGGVGPPPVNPISDGIRIAAYVSDNPTPRAQFADRSVD